MSNLKYYAYPGWGEFARDNLGYSQAVRVGDRIELSGQGGVGDDGSDIPSDLRAEIEKTFENVEKALKHAGGKGWSQVFRVNSYHTNLDMEVTKIMGECFAKWMPDHKPIWTEIGVAKLGLDEMRVEIEVSAYDPEGAKSA